MPQLLIIDDDATMRDVLYEMMTMEGYSAMTAANGLEALKLLEIHRFDCIITDIVMPEKEGLETILHIRKHFPDLPVIAMSGGARIKPESYLDLAKQFGARYVFPKPFVKKDIVAAIKECLAHPAAG